MQTAAVTTAMSTAVNTPVTFMSVGTDKSDDALVWFIDQANYLLGLDSPPKVLVGDWPLSEFFEDAALARSVRPTDIVEIITEFLSQVAM